MITYLACPYTHSMSSVREARVAQATVVAAQLTKLGRAVYSPITHGHQLSRHVSDLDNQNHRFWMSQCLPFLAASDRLVLLPLLGWTESLGVAEELAYATSRGLSLYIWQEPSPDLPSLHILDAAELEQFQLTSIGFPDVRT